MPPSPGEQLAHYTLVDKLGEGAMGEVWEALDTRLDRRVALKLLPEAFVEDPERRARFEREARVLAALNHPSIAAIHELHADLDHPFLVLELAPGEDLSERLARGRLSGDEVVEIARRIAAALDAAHAAGVVHRDLKPANVKIGDDGTVKVLDFGLAKFFDPSPDRPEHASGSHLPTITSGGTKAGAILGSAAYMSPEQARGRAVDRRTDLWAFGCVLYESLTGRRAFQGETVSDTIAAVLRSEPDWSALPPDTPASLRRLLRLCLVKDPARRWRDAGDALVLLGDAESEPAAAPIAPQAPARSSSIIGWIVVVVIVVAVMALMSTYEKPSPPRVIDARLDVPDDHRLVRASLSPDGRTAAFVLDPIDDADSAWGHRIALRRLDRNEFVLLEERIGRTHVVFSPDSEELAFVSNEHPGLPARALVRTRVDGRGTPTLVTAWNETWSEYFGWTKANELLVHQPREATIRRFPTDGRPAPPPVRLEDDDVFSVLIYDSFDDGSALATVESFYEGYSQRIVRLDLETGRMEVLVDRGFEPRLLDDGHLVFSRGSQLVALPIDPSSGETRGAERTVARGLRTKLELTSARFATSRGGDLLYPAGGSVGTDRVVELALPDGRRRTWTSESAPFVAEAISIAADGSLVATTVMGSGKLYEVWAAGSDQPRFQPVLRDDEEDCSNVVVSPRGRLIAARCWGESIEARVFTARPAAASAKPQIVHAGGTKSYIEPVAWSPDERGLYVLLIDEQRRWIEFQSLDDDGAPVGDAVELRGTPSEMSTGLSISADGRFAALVSWSGATRELSVARLESPTQLVELRVLGPISDGPVVWEPNRDASLRLLFERDGRLSFVTIDHEGRIGDVTIHEAGAAGESPGGTLSEDRASNGSVVRLLRGPSELEPVELRIVTSWSSTWTR